MQQGWVSIAGLALDAIGFIIIAWGWLKQWRWQHENFWVDLVRRHYENLRPGMRMARGYMDTYRQIYMRRLPDYTWLDTGEVEDLMLVTRGLDHLIADDHIKDRKRTFLVGLALVLVGFSIQGLGNVPGGIPVLRIYPNGSMPAPPVVNIAGPDRLPPPYLNLKQRYRRAWPSQTK